MTKRNTKLAVAAAVVTALAGTGAAVAASQGSAGGTGRQAYVNDVAKHLGVSPSALSAALQAAAVDRIDAAVAAGRLTAAQGAAAKQRIQQGGGLGLGFGFRARGAGRHGLRQGLIGTAAQYLGIDRATLHSDLQQGKSLAAIAAATPGKSVAGLKAALTSAAKTKLDAAVTAGRMTSAQEQTILGNLPQRLDKLLARTRAPGVLAH